MAGIISIIIDPFQNAEGTGDGYVTVNMRCELSVPVVSGNINFTGGITPVIFEAALTEQEVFALLATRAAEYVNGQIFGTEVSFAETDVRRFY